MELIKDLCEEYDRRNNTADNEDLPSLGYENVNVEYAIDIDSTGKVLDIVNLTEDVIGANGKTIHKKRVMRAPKKPVRVGSKAYEKVIFLSEFVKYFFGDYVEEGLDKCFLSAKDYYTEHMHNINDDFADAIIGFFNTMKSQDFSVFDNFESVLKCKTQLVFLYQGEYSVYHDSFTTYWEKLYIDDNPNVVRMDIDCIDGTLSPIAKNHDKIITISDSNVTALVTNNMPSAMSYGFDRCNCVSISLRNQFKYVSMLKYLLTHKENHIDVEQGGKNRHTVQKIAFWSEFKPVNNICAEMLGTSGNGDIDLETELQGAVSAISHGNTTNVEMLQNNVGKIHIVGVSNHASRMTVDFYSVYDVKTFLHNIKKYSDNIKLENVDSYSISALLKECFKEGDVKAHASEYHLFANKTFQSVLEGVPFPSALIKKVLDRIMRERNDKENYHYYVNNKRVSFIKAILRSNYNRSDIMDRLDENNTSVAYILGRIMAVYENCVESGLKNKKGSKYTSEMLWNVFDSKFSMMMNRPKIALVNVQKSFKIYLHKVDEKYAGYKQNQFDKIVEMISVPEMPTNMSQQQRCEYVLGYHHQKANIYKKKSVDK